MFDIHTHILPGIDDGSRSIEMSRQMLQASKGLEGIAFTPHFYADSTDPDTFIARRNEAYRALAQTTRIDIPVILGAEVYFYRGMARSEHIRKLTLGNTDYILIEMPFSNWNQSTINEIEDLLAEGLRPVIAHIERYLDQDRKLVRRLIDDQDILIQSNASFIASRKFKAMRMLRNGDIDLLGSDCHNTTTRRQNLPEALQTADNSKTREQLGRIRYNGYEIFREAGAVR